jgi:general secretion pathway protein A
MYMEIYGLREQPFGVTPNPRFLYFSALHKTALSSLVNSVCERRGFSALIAKPGMGKTTLIMQLLSLLRDSARTGFLFQTHGSTQEFLAALLQDIDAPTASYDLVDMQKALNAAVLREARANRQLVIVVDEAQNLSDETLESIRLLSNFENPEAKLLHIVLAGQPPLADKLAAPHLAQLRQRLAVVAHLSPFTREQISEYIHRRLQIAGRTSDTSLFAPDALEFIAQASEGIPRNINNLCFHALTLGYSARKPVLDLAVAQQAARALDLKGSSPAFARRFAPAAPARSIPSPVPVSQLQPAQEWARMSQRVDSLSSAAPAKPRRQKKWFKSKTSVVVFSGAVMLVVLLRAGVLPTQMFAYFAYPSTENGSLAAPPKASTTSKSPVAPTSSDSIASQDTPDTEDITGSSAKMAENARLVHTQAKEDVEQLTRRYFGAHTGDVLPVVMQLNPGIATPPVALPPGTAVMIPTNSSNAERSNAAGHAHVPENNKKSTWSVSSERYSTPMPKHVEVTHTETIFEFALEHCGKADHTTIEAIRVANPQIGDIYQTLQKGQPMAVPPISGSLH